MTLYQLGYSEDEPGSDRTARSKLETKKFPGVIGLLRAVVGLEDSPPE